MARAKQYRLEHDPKYFESLASLYHFEEFYQFKDHLFEKPEQSPTSPKKQKEYYEAADRASTQNVIDFLERATQIRSAKNDDSESPEGAG